MDDVAIIDEIASRLFAQKCTTDVIVAADGGGWSSSLWGVLDKTDWIGGGDLANEAAIVRCAARYAAPIPLAEHLVARRVLQSAGVDPVPPGPLTVTDWRKGQATRVPYGRYATIVLLDDAGTVGILDPEGAIFSTETNIAGEPRDSVAGRFMQVGRSNLRPDDLLRSGALMRAVQITGALQRVMQLTVAYAADRIQFGQPIRRFQAVAQNLAVVAGEVATAHAVADAAVEDPSRWKIAAARVRVGEAAGRTADIAHQVHGAIGFTSEHVLGYFTRRLWAWRDEFGTEAMWAGELGKEVLSTMNLWEMLTRERDSL